VTDVWWAVQFPYADGFRHPVVLYDGATNLLLMLYLLHVRPRPRPARDGDANRGGHTPSSTCDMLNWSTTSQSEVKMATVTAFEAKTRFGELLERVSKGEEVVITRHDRPVARLIPEGVPRLDEVRRSVQGLRDLQQRIRQRSKSKLSDRQVRAAIDEGRM
jgi:prevent-host-death family protein